MNGVSLSIVVVVALMGTTTMTEEEEAAAGCGGSRLSINTTRYTKRHEDLLWHSHRQSAVNLCFVQLTGELLSFSLG